jgi:hypothetical protein
MGESERESMLNEPLQIGLKEWAAVCLALESGRQMVLLRKGGIYEAAGEFEIEHRRFFLFPSYLHQKLDQIKPPDRGLLELRSSEPREVRLSTIGTITDILQLHERKQVESIDFEHIWGPGLIEMRFNYRPENPLYLLLVRAYRLARPILIENTPAYAGCKSWVPLEKPLASDGAIPVIEEAAFQLRRQEIMRLVEQRSRG